MSRRDYESAPVSERLGLGDVIRGLATDLESLRAGKLSPQQALAHAAVAKQMFNGVRLYLQATKDMEARAKDEPHALVNDERGPPR